MRKLLNSAVSRRAVLGAGLATAGILTMPSILRAQDRSIKVGVYGPLCWLAWLVVAPRFYRQSRQFASLTLSDFLGTRYDSTALRRLTAVVILMACSLYLVAIYKGSSHALEQFLGFSYGWAALVIFSAVQGVLTVRKFAQGHWKHRTI